MGKSQVDILWILVSSGLVFMMQAGFLCLEAGLTRSKNSINVALKNIADFGLSMVLFWAFGFAFMFGTTQSGWLGTDHFFVSIDLEKPWLATFFLFQVMFCGTAVTIISGAVAERLRFNAYFMISVAVSALIYPVFGHWAWGGAYVGNAGWLSAMGFIDFAGSSVVHSVGGGAALAILLIIGPRAGRFIKGEAPRYIPGSHVPLALLGMLLIWLGWIGFNGGSTLAMNDQVAGIIVNTMLAGGAGLCMGLLLSQLFYDHSVVDLAMNGSLAGLVAITANCHVVDAPTAVLIGSVGAVVMTLCAKGLEHFGIDDAVGAVPVHLGAGIWGTLAVALFGHLDGLGTGLDRWAQLGVQGLGGLVCFGWSFGITYGLFFVINKIRPLRVSLEDEKLGLNVVEHHATTEILDLLNTMDLQAQSKDLSLRVPVEPFTEIGQIAKHYNLVMDSLEESIAKIDAIVRTAKDGIITFAKDSMTILSANPSAELMFGCQGGDMVGKPIVGFLSRDKDAHIFSRVSQGDGLGMHEIIGKRLDNSHFPVEVIVTEVEVGNDIFYTSTFRDITERKQAEEKLRNSEVRLRNLIEHQPDGVCLLSEHLELIMVNQEGRACLDILSQKVNVGDRLEWVGGEALVNLLMGAAHSRPHEVEVDVDGTKYIFEIYGRALTEHIRGGGWVVIIRNVTTERSIQERVQQQDRLAAVGQLAAGIAHDFNNLLTGINGFAQLLELRSDMPEPAKEILQRIYLQGERAAQLVRQILDFSRKTVVERKPMELVPFFKEMTRLLQRILPESIEITTQVEGKDHVVVGNPTQIQQVLTNLAVNARDAMPNGGTLHLALQVFVLAPSEKPPVTDMPAGKWSHICISDTGTGIATDHLEHIFEPFFTTKEVGKGTGLGMAQVYGIVKQHDGFIDVETELGHGTTFHIYLPESQEKTAEPQVQGSDVPRGQGETVLLVEDDFAVRQAAEGMLKQLNYNVMTAFNGQDALVRYANAKETVDAVLTDVVMPEMNGVELLQALKDMTPDLPVLLMTGYPMGESSSENVKNHDGYLEKPLSIELVGQALHKAFQRSV